MKVIKSYNSLNEMKGYKMIIFEKFRIDLNEIEIEVLKNLAKEHLTNSKSDVYDSLKEKLNNPTIINYSENKARATIKATEVRSAKAKAKIKQAKIELDRELMRGFIKKVSYYAVAKKSGVHINTVKKYITINEVN